MKPCDSIQPMLSALIDGELSSEDTLGVQAHLEICSSCQRDRESLIAVDSQLTKSLRIDDLQDRTASIRLMVEKSVKPQPEGSRRMHWLAFAAAAVLLFAFVAVMRGGGDGSIPLVNRPVVVAQLVRATGPFEFLAASASEWMMLGPNSSRAFVAGDHLRTGDDILCEFRTPEKGLIRLSDSAELVFGPANQLELLAGQLWCSAPLTAGIAVEIPVHDETAPKLATFLCPSSSELQCAVDKGFATCSSSATNRLDVSMSMESVSCSLAPGETVSVDAKQTVERLGVPKLENKVWQLPLLAVGSKVDSELMLSMKHLLAPIGITKLMHLNEQQIRQLGAPGAIPLLAFVLEDSSPENSVMRRTAMRLAADLADERGVGLLNALKSNPDPQISKLANQTLSRLAKQLP